MNKIRQKTGKDSGFSLMEYAVGLVVLVAIGYASMQLFANGMNNFFSGAATWATARGTDLVNSNP